MAIILVFGRLRQEDPELEDSMGHTARCYLQNKYLTMQSWADHSTPSTLFPLGMSPSKKAAPPTSPAGQGIPIPMSTAMLEPLSSVCPLHLMFDQFLSPTVLPSRHKEVTLLTPCSRPIHCLPGPVLPKSLGKPASHSYLLHLGPSSSSIAKARSSPCRPLWASQFT